MKEIETDSPGHIPSFQDHPYLSCQASVATLHCSNLLAGLRAILTYPLQVGGLKEYASPVSFLVALGIRLALSFGTLYRCFPQGM